MFEALRRSGPPMLCFVVLGLTGCTASEADTPSSDEPPAVVDARPDDAEVPATPAPLVPIDGGKLHQGVSFIRAPDPGLRVTLREGAWDDLDALLAADVIAAGSQVVDVIDLAPASRDTDVALEFRGHLAVPKSGVYTFAVRATTAARLTITQRRIVEGSGSGAIGLAAGYHPFHLVWMHGEGGAAQLDVTWEGPAGSGPLPAKVLVQ